MSFFSAWRSSHSNMVVNGCRSAQARRNHERNKKHKICTHKMRGEREREWSGTWKIWDGKQRHWWTNGRKKICRCQPAKINYVTLMMINNYVNPNQRTVELAMFDAKKYSQCMMVWNDWLLVGLKSAMNKAWNVHACLLWIYSLFRFCLLCIAMDLSQPRTLVTVWRPSEAYFCWHQ